MPGPVGLDHEKRDQAVSKALARGDPREAAHLLVRHFGDEVYRFCVNTLNNQADGEELAQEVMTAACRSLAGFEGRSSLRTWLFRLARHKLDDFYRRQARTPAAAPLEEAEAVVAPVAEEALEEKQRRERLARSLGRLGPDDRQVLAMRISQELAFAEIARILGVREGTARMRVGRAVERLKEEMRRDER